MSNPLVTVAISTYNVGQYVDYALRCVESQSYKNIEILCIDDNSTDNTLCEILSHAEKDSRYRVIVQDCNKGLSVSRNLAIEEAKGKYIIMVDGDDLFDELMVEKAVYVAEKNDADMVMWDYIPFSSTDELSDRMNKKSELSSVDMTDKTVLLQRPAFMWVRLLKMKMLKKLDINFVPGLTKQDIPVHWRLVTALEKIVLLPECLSFYRIQPNATSCRKDSSVFSLAKVMDIVGEYLRKSGLYETYKNEYLRSRLSLLHGMYDFIKPDLKSEALKMIYNRLDNDERTYLKCKNDLGFRTNVFYGKLSGNPLDCFIYKIILTIRSIYRYFLK